MSRSAVIIMERQSASLSSSHEEESPLTFDSRWTTPQTVDDSLYLSEHPDDDPPEYTFADEGPTLGYRPTDTSQPPAYRQCLPDCSESGTFASTPSTPVLPSYDACVVADDPDGNNRMLRRLAPLPRPPPYDATMSGNACNLSAEPLEPTTCPVVSVTIVDYSPPTVAIEGQLDDKLFEPDSASIVLACCVCLFCCGIAGIVALICAGRNIIKELSNGS